MTGMLGGTFPGTDPRANGRPEEFVRYRWRDPARCSPERLAELAAHDQHIAALARQPAPRDHGSSARQRGAGPAISKSAIKAAESARKRAAYYAGRDAGQPVAVAARRADVSARLGYRWEKARRDQKEDAPQ